MYTHFDRRFNRMMSIIHPGEFYSSNEKIIISTILGSCVAVALFDPVTRRSGLNHFMLPGSFQSKNLFQEESGRYGMYAMELLINDMLKQGARRDRLQAKVFGGGHVLHQTSTGSIPESNVRFALAFLETEQIPILTQDLGGTEARKILLFPENFRVLLKRFGGQKTKPVEREEEAYLTRIQARKKKTEEPDVTFF